MKLRKDSRPRINIKSIVATGVVIALVVVTAISFSNNGKVGVLEKLGISNGSYSIGKHINNVVTGTAQLFDDIVSFRANSKKVKELTAENEKLKQQIIELNDNENMTDSLEILKKSLNFVSGDRRDRLVSASIIGKNDGDWYKSFVIDAGADQGVVENSIVINGKGVVGIVYSVNNRYSKAISIIDSRASVSFKITGKEDSKGVITTSSEIGSSDLKDIEKLLQGYFFDKNAKVKTGDTIVTSGLGLYPENIPIGKITLVNYDKNKSLKHIKVKPNVDFKNLDVVSIIPPRDIN